MNRRQKDFERETLKGLKALEGEMICSRKMIYEMCKSMSLEVEHFLPSLISDSRRVSDVPSSSCCESKRGSDAPSISHSGNFNISDVPDYPSTGSQRQERSFDVAHQRSSLDIPSRESSVRHSKEYSECPTSTSLHSAWTAEKSNGSLSTLKQMEAIIPRPSKKDSPKEATLNGSSEEPQAVSTRMSSMSMSFDNHRAMELAAKALAVFKSKPKQSPFAMKVWNFLDNPDSSSAAGILDRAELYFFFITVVFTLLQTIEPRPMSEAVSTAVEISIESLLLVEVLIRYYVSPIRGPMFFLAPFNTIDVLTVMPLALRIAVLQTSLELEDCDAIFLCLVPILRLLKMMRRFHQIHLLFGAFKHAAEALPVLMFCQAVITLTFAAAVYLVEPRDNIESLPKAVWFTVVTMTTVGYGDVTPVSTWGYCIVIVLTIVSVLYMAIPLGIVGHAFRVIWEDRDKILLLQKARAALRQWGYTAKDIPVLCQIFDTSGTGELNINDFSRMIHMMRIGLKVNRVIELFDSFDEDGSGTIDTPELVHIFFPHDFHSIYGKATEDSDAAVAQRNFKPRACQCGERLMPDAVFCRKCGKKATSRVTFVEGATSKDDGDDGKNSEEARRWATKRRLAASTEHIQS